MLNMDNNNTEGSINEEIESLNKRNAMLAKKIQNNRSNLHEKV